MIDNREVIKESCDADQWREFEERVEMLRPEDLEAINDRLGAGVPAGSNWHDYVDAFAEYSWRDFTEAYEHDRGGTY